MSDTPTEILLHVSIGPGKCKVRAGSGMTPAMVELALHLLFEQQQLGKLKIECQTLQIEQQHAVHH